MRVGGATGVAESASNGDVPTKDAGNLRGSYSFEKIRSFIMGAGN